MANDTFRGHSIETLSNVFDAVKDGVHWKRPWKCTVSVNLIGVVLAAVEFYHADTNVQVSEPVNGCVEMRGNGYQAW